MTALAAELVEHANEFCSTYCALETRNRIAGQERIYCDDRPVQELAVIQMADDCGPETNGGANP